MTITAKIIEHSMTHDGAEIVTMQLCYPRFIHAEFMTHRAFSRNASSSRAIPVAKMIDMVVRDPAMPIHWGKNQPGMQANEQLTGEDLAFVRESWLIAAANAAVQARRMMNAGAHKQIANRILEPFQHMHVIVTATDWSNWSELRAHPDAQPEIHALAIAMQTALDESKWPTRRARDRQDAYSWHLPYVTTEERALYRHHPTFLAKLSVARCARVSYLTHDGKAPDTEKDLALFDRLVGSRPLHASPTEHQAYPLPLATQRSRNFTGWRQHREIIEHQFSTNRSTP